MSRAAFFASLHKFCFATVQDRPIMVKVMKNITLPIVIEADGDGFFVSCPALQGCYSQGDTYEEAVENIKDAIKLHIEDRLAGGEEIPQVSVSLSTVEIAV
jgi:predicted RNase H-like HicB family nuclease